jgi:putative DNA primase/helicase
MTDEKPKLRIVASLEGAEVLSDGATPAATDPAPPVEPDGTIDPGLGQSTSEDSTKRDGEDLAALDMDCAFLPRTDLGNAQRFTRRYGGDFLYVEQWGWLAWDGKRWNGDEAAAILSRAVHDTIKAIAREAKAMKGSPHDVHLDEKKDVWLSDKISGWCLASQGNAHITCVAKLAQAYLTASPDSFDADPLAFNVDNGTLRFKKSETEPYVTFHAHQRLDRMTKITPVGYDKDALCPVYDAFLARVQPDAGMQRHLHAWAGVSLTGLPLAKMAFWYGLGRNGKGTTAEVWAHVAGDYSQSIPIESFLEQGRARRGGEASPDIASLAGVRFLRTSEPERNAKLAEGMIKLVTGGDKISARHLNRDFFEFFPCFKLTMQGNHKPKIEGVDNGIWSRILVVPWLVTIPEEEQDTDLAAKLKAEGPGILNRLLDGLCDYLDHGLMAPDSVTAATAAYREDMDPIGQFLEECTMRREPAVNVETGKATPFRVGAQEIFSTYVAWAKAYGERPRSHKAFSHGLTDHGIRRLKSSGIYYLGIVMTKDASSFAGMEITDPYDRKR